MMRAVIRWRLMDLGHMPLAEPEAFIDQRIRDLVVARHITEIASTMPLEAAKMTGELKTSAGYVRALSGVAKHLDAREPELAQSLIHRATECGLESDWDGFEAALELLKVAIRWPGRTRERLLTFCLNVSARLEPKWMQPDARLALGRILAGAFTEAATNDDAFFRSIIQEYDMEIPRKILATHILENLPEDSCGRVAENLVAFGLAPQTGVFPSIEDELFLPETQVELLACLAGRLTKDNPEAGSQLLMQAADISASIENEQDRKEASSKIINRAIKIAPSFALEVYPRCGTNLDSVFLELEQVLREYVEAGRNSREWLLRLNIEYTLLPDNFGSESEYHQYMTERKSAMEENIFPALSERHPKIEKPRDEWLQDLPRFLSQCIESLGSWSEQPLLAHLPDVVKLAAAADLGCFMEIVHDLQFHPGSLWFMGSREIQRHMIKSDIDASQLLDLTNEIRKAMNRDIEEPDFEDTRFGSVTIAAAAAYDPDACIDMVASLAPESRCSFVKDIDYYTSEKAWTKQQLSSLFMLMEASPSKGEAIVSQARMLGWLAQSSAVVSSFAEHIVHAASDLSKGFHIFKVANYIKQVDKGACEALAEIALDRGIHSNDINEMLELFEERTLLAPEIRLQALGSALELDMEKRLHVVKIAGFQAELDPEKALKTLSYIDEYPIGMSDTLDAIAKAALITNEKDLRLWLSKVSDQDLDQLYKDYLAKSLINRGLELRVLKSPEILRHIAYTDDRVEALITMAEQLEGYEKQEVLTQAHREARSGSSFEQRGKACCKLAEFYIPSDPVHALELYKLGLKEAEKDGVTFSVISECAQACFHLPTEQSVVLADSICDTVQRFPDIRGYRPGIRALGLLWSAIALWSLDKCRSIELLKEAADEYNNKAHLTIMKILWGPELTDAYTALAIQSSIGDAREMLSETLDTISDVRRQEVADSIANKCLSLRNEADRPLQYLGIWQRRLDKTKCALLSHLSPFFSANVAAASHFALAITAWGRDHRIVKREMSHAANIIERIHMPEYYINEGGDIWIAYALSQGIEGCRRAAYSMLVGPEVLGWSSVVLLICTINQRPERETFIRELWGSLQSLRDYA